MNIFSWLACVRALHPKAISSRRVSAGTTSGTGSAHIPRVHARLAAGCSFFYVPHEFTFTGPHRDLVGAVESSKPHEVVAYFQKLFADPREKMTAEQIEVVGRYNGADQMTTPEGLREQLGV